MCCETANLDYKINLIKMKILKIKLLINNFTEGYRSGHNEAVLKTVCPQGRKGSNPFLSAVIMGTAVNILQVVSQHEKIDTKFFLEYVS